MMDSPHANDPSGATGSQSPSVDGSNEAACRGELRDVVAELTERAQLIGREASGRVASTMRDVLGAGAGIAGFAMESARDLVQFMVRRGQMTAQEGDQLIRDAEAAQRKRSPAEKPKKAATGSATDAAKNPKTAKKARTKSTTRPSTRPAARSGKSISKNTSAKPDGKAKPSARSAPAKKKTKREK